jgi:phosphoglycolate phosphatase-like HAD superfamily hydrolase
VALVAGQEQGSKKEHLALAAGERYEREKVLMVGDALGDWDAARACGALFYPIAPGCEDESWQRFFEEALPRFFAGEYAGEYNQALLESFTKLLPEEPPW